jgi:hypothetical protein
LYQNKSEYEKKIDISPTTKGSWLALRGMSSTKVMKWNFSIAT